MSKLSRRLLALATGTGVSVALAMAFSGQAMASENATAKPTSHHTTTHQVPVRHLPQSKPPAHRPDEGRKKPGHTKPRCKVHCPKSKTTVVKRSTKVVTSVVQRDHHKFLKKVTYRVELVRHTYYTQSGRKCVKHVSYSVHRQVVSVRYVPIKHRPVVVKPPKNSVHPIVWHKPTKPVVHTRPAPHHESKPIKAWHKVHKAHKPPVKQHPRHHKCPHKNDSKHHESGHNKQPHTSQHAPSHGAPAASQQA